MWSSNTWTMNTNKAEGCLLELSCEFEVYDKCTFLCFTIVQTWKKAFFFGLTYIMITN